MTYLIIDADGSFDSAGRGHSYVHEVCNSAYEARKLASKMMQVQIVIGSLCKGDVVDQQSVGTIFPRVESEGSDQSLAGIRTDLPWLLGE